MLRVLFIFALCFLHLANADRAAQLVDKAQIDNAVLTSNMQQYVNGIYKMNQDGADSIMISSILRGYSSPPIAVLNTNGMISEPLLPVISKYMLLVSTTRYAAPLPPGETILKKDVNLFGTIQSAINYAVNNPITPVIMSSWTILIEAGTYLENLYIQRTPYNPTQMASLTFAALGKVTLGDGSTTGNVYWYVNNNPNLSGSRYPAVIFTVYRLSDTNYNARWNITKNFTFTRAPGYTRSTMLHLHYVTVKGSFVSDFLITTFSECIFEKLVIMEPTSTADYLMGSEGSVYKGLVGCYFYAKIINSKFLDGLYCSKAYTSSSEGLSGFYHCLMQGIFTVTGTPPDNTFYIDTFTNAASTSATFSNKTLLIYP